MTSSFLYFVSLIRYLSSASRSRCEHDNIIDADALLREVGVNKVPTPMLKLLRSSRIIRS
ncbi:MAG: hypothetical protein ACLR5G_11310 [Eubacteriales bacterium]